MDHLTHVNAPNVQYSNDSIRSQYVYHSSSATRDAKGRVTVVPTSQKLEFVTKTALPKLGLMMVGWGGNNGSTVTAAIIANREKIAWETRTGKQQPNWFGSVTQASTVNVGSDPATGADVYVPLNSLVPMVDPNTFVVGGWDINSFNIADAMRRAQVLEPDLIRQLEPHTKNLKPLTSIYYPDFIAANQSDRANNLKEGNDKQKHLEAIRADIRDFKKRNKCDKVVVV